LRAIAEEIALDIVYETTTSPSSTSPRHDGACGRGSHDDAAIAGTLVNALLHHFGTLSAIGGELRPALSIG